MSILIAGLALYCTAAVAIAGHAIYNGVLRARSDPRLDTADHLLLTLSSAVVGALWPLFMPAVLYGEARAHTRRARQRSERQARTWSVARAG
jgi:hypothetical protein